MAAFCRNVCRFHKHLLKARHFQINVRRNIAESWVGGSCIDRKCCHLDPLGISSRKCQNVSFPLFLLRQVLAFTKSGQDHETTRLTLTDNHSPGMVSRTDNLWLYF